MGHIVVTGCAGFRTRRLTRRLRADGRTVVGVDSFEAYYPRAAGEANLANARATLSDAIAMLGRVMGVQPRLDAQPAEAGDVWDTWADVSRAVEPFGYAPTTRPQAGLGPQSAWLGAQLPKPGEAP